MKTLLTPQLLGFLIEHGYTCCHSHTEIVEADHTRVITLTPMKGKPDLNTIPEDCRPASKIPNKPLQMRCNMDNTKVYLNIDLHSDKRTFSMMSAYGVMIN